MSRPLVVSTVACVFLLLLVPALYAEASDPTEVRVIPSTAAVERGLAGGDSLDVRRVGGWPFGGTGPIAIDHHRNLVFVGTGAVITVLDMSDPTSPTTVSESAWTQAAIQNLTFHPGTERLYVAQGYGGMEIWDVADPSEPSFLGRYRLTHFDHEAPIFDIQVRGQWAYAAAGWAVIHRFDVSDPTAPIHFSYINGFESIDDLYLSGDELYAIGDVLWRFQLGPDGSMTFSGEVLTHGGVVDVQNGFAYITRNGDVWIFDVSGPSFSFTGQYDGNNIRNLTVVGSTCYAVDVIEGIYALDVSDPTSPAVIDYHPGGSNQIAFAGSDAVIATDDGIRFVDYSDVSNPLEIGFADLIDACGDLEIDGDTAYLATNDGLVTLDITDLDRPSLLARRDVTTRAYAVRKVGATVYLSDETAGFRVFDVSDPSAPVQQGFLPLSGYNRQIRVVGQYVFLAEFQTGLRIIDVSNPAAPLQIGFWSSPGNVWDFDIQGEYLYVASGEAGLRALDVSTPTAPSEVGAIVGPDMNATGIDVQGARAYVAKWTEGLGVVDITTPEMPVELGSITFSTFSFTNTVAVSGSFAFVDDQTELIVIDCSDPTLPEIAGYYDARIVMGGMDVIGATAYVANAIVGLQAFEYIPGIVEVGPSVEEGPIALAVAAHPNPTNGSVSLVLDVHIATDVTIRVFDAAGRLVRALPGGVLPVGRRILVWDGRDGLGRSVAPGVYYVDVDGSTERVTRRVVVTH